MAATVFFFSGCGLHVNQEKEVATYRKIVDQGVPAVRFSCGEPLSLEKALILANQYNERIALQGENYLQSLINRDRAAATFLPTVSLAPTYFEQQPPPDNGTGTASSTGGGNRRLDVPVTGRMNVFNGFSDLNNYQAAGQTIEQRRALLLDAQAAVLIDVAETYYQVLRSERSVQVLRNTLAVQEERVRDARARRAVGTVPQLDVAQTEAQAAATRSQLLLARNNVVTGRATLSYLIGVEVNGSELVDEAPIPQEIAALDVFQQVAQRSRPDLAAAHSAVAAAKYIVDAAIGQYFPSVTINAAYYLSRESLPSESDWNYLLSVNVPIFSAGIIEANIRQAWSQLRQARLSELSLQRQVVQQVQIAYENLMTSRARQQELLVQQAAAAESLRQAEGLYKAGLARNLDVLTAQDALLSAQLQLASEEFNQKVFYMDLLRAAGTLSTRLPGEPTTQPSAQPSTQPATSPATTMPAV